MVMTVRRHIAMSPLKMLLLSFTESRNSEVSTVILEKHVKTNMAHIAKKQVELP